MELARNGLPRRLPHSGAGRPRPTISSPAHKPSLHQSALTFLPDKIPPQPSKSARHRPLTPQADTRQREGAWFGKDGLVAVTNVVGVYAKGPAQCRFIALQQLIAGMAAGSVTDADNISEPGLAVGRCDNHLIPTRCAYLVVAFLQVGPDLAPFEARTSQRPTPRLARPGRYWLSCPGARQQRYPLATRQQPSSARSHRVLPTVSLPSCRWP